MERLSTVDADWSHSPTFGSLGNERKKEPENVNNLRCKCKMTNCLKRYCECFAAQYYCEEVCECKDCLNRPSYEDTVSIAEEKIESRDPLAFARHKSGCNCKKSSCLKKYCECYQAGVACSRACRCEGCKNIFGWKNECGEIAKLVYKANDESLERDPYGGNIGGAEFKSKLGASFPYNSEVSPLTPVLQGSNDYFVHPYQFPPRYSTTAASNASLTPSFVQSPSSPEVFQGIGQASTDYIFSGTSTSTPVQQFGESKYMLEPDSEEGWHHRYEDGSKKI